MNQHLSAEQVREMLSEFVDCLYDPEDIVEIRMLPCGLSGSTHAEKLPTELSDGRVLSESQRGQGIFVGVNPRSCRVQQNQTAKECPGGRCGKCDRCVALARVVFADLDGASVEEAAARVQSADLPDPTLIVASGHGVHVYWRLEQPMDDPQEWTRVQKRIAKLLDSDPTVCNPSRIMRVPGFLNHKRPTALCQVVRAEPTTRVPLEKLLTCLPTEDEESDGETCSGGVQVNLTTMADAMKYLDQIPGAVQGEHGDDHTFRAACKMVRDFAMPFDLAFELLRVWNGRCQPPWPEKDLRAKLEHALKYGKGPIGSKVQGPVAESAESATQQDAVHAQDADVLSAESAYRDLTFPIDALPPCLQPFVREAAEAISCPQDYIAVPMLTALGAVIGRSRRIEVKPGWTESAALWTLMVGDSGTAKTPAMEAALEHVFDPLEGAGATWVTDTTAEALAQLMSEHPRGVFLCRDELSAWIRSFGQYKGGRGSDESFFLECWSGARTRVTRKVGEHDDVERKRFTVPQPFLAITGGIQPTVLSRLVSHDRIESGFAARFLLSYPPRMMRRFTETSIAQEAGSRVAEVFKLFGLLEPSPEGAPVIVGFTPEGREERRRVLEEHQAEMSRLPSTSPLLTAWSKMEGHVARLMLVLHLVRAAAKEADDKGVDAETVRRAEQLLGYFKAHAIRVYSGALQLRGTCPSIAGSRIRGADGAPGEANKPVFDKETERTVAWMQRRGDPGVQPRDLIASRIATNTQEAQRIFEQLVAAGMAYWSATDTGQRLFLCEDVERQSAA